MTRLQAVGLCVVAACLGFAWPAGAAGKYDGSAPMLCAVTADLEVFVGNCRRDTGHGESCPEEQQDHRAAHGDRHARSAIGSDSNFGSQLADSPEYRQGGLSHGGRVDAIVGVEIAAAARLAELVHA